MSVRENYKMPTAEGFLVRYFVILQPWSADGQINGTSTKPCSNRLSNSRQKSKHMDAYGLGYELR